MRSYTKPITIPIGTKKCIKGLSMANSPTDKSKQFVESGMTLITQPESDYWLKKIAMVKKEQERVFNNQVEWADGFVGK